MVVHTANWGNSPIANLKHPETSGKSDDQFDIFDF